MNCNSVLPKRSLTKFELIESVTNPGANHWYNKTVSVKIHRKSMESRRPVLADSQTDGRSYARVVQVTVETGTRNLRPPKTSVGIPKGFHFAVGDSFFINEYVSDKSVTIVCHSRYMKSLVLSFLCGQLLEPSAQLQNESFAPTILRIFQTRFFPLQLQHSILLLKSPIFKW